MPLAFSSLAPGSFAWDSALPPAADFSAEGGRAGARGQDQSSRGCEGKACPEPVEGTMHRVAPAVIRLEFQADADEEVEHAFALDFAGFAFGGPGNGGAVHRVARVVGRARRHCSFVLRHRMRHRAAVEGHAGIDIGRRRVDFLDDGEPVLTGAAIYPVAGPVEADADGGCAVIVDLAAPAEGNAPLGILEALIAFLRRPCRMTR